MPSLGGLSKDIDPATVSGSSFTVACPAGTPVLADASYDAATRVATLIPAAALPAGTVCVATLSTAIRDTSGIPLAAAYVWSFVTAIPFDAVRPTVTLTVPAANATAVPINTAITATFSEDMNPATISATSFTVVNSTLGTAVVGSVAYSATSRTAIFTPTTPATLPNNTRFTATVTTAATDLAGNALEASHVWSFTTAALPDTTAPTVTLAVPAPNATTVPNNTAVTATFSEDMNATTISGATFTLVNTTLGSAVPGVVSYSATSRTAIFTPNTPATLAPNSQFTVTVTTGVADLAGNNLAANFVWTFTTVALPDTTRPTVTVTVPAAGATAVASNTAITATFSEAMNPADHLGDDFHPRQHRPWHRRSWHCQPLRHEPDGDLYAHHTSHAGRQHAVHRDGHDGCSRPGGQHPRRELCVDLHHRGAARHDTADGDVDGACARCHGSPQQHRGHGDLQRADEPRDDLGAELHGRQHQHWNGRRRDGQLFGSGADGDLWSGGCGAGKQ